jgi:hypothetical protein
LDLVTPGGVRNAVADLVPQLGPKRIASSVQVRRARTQ